MRWFFAMLRESRGSRGRLIFFTACIAIGVAAVVGVAAMAGTVEDGLRAGARELLTADLRVSSRRKLDPGIEEMLRAGGVTQTTHYREFASMVAPVDAGGKLGPARIARMKTIRGEYPFYGALVLDPPGTLADALTRGIVVAPEVGVPPGQNLRIGRKLLPVVAVIREEPQEFGFMSMMGPRIYLHEDQLEGSGLLGFGSRMSYGILARHPGPGLDELAESLEADAPGAEYLNVDTWRTGQRRLQQSIANVERYLGLVALLSLILGGIGVAQIVGAWITSRTRTIAILRCVGMRPKEILTLFLGQVAILALVGSILGAVGGSIVPFAFADLASEMMTGKVAGGSIQPGAIAYGMSLGVGIAVLFSLPPLTAVWRVPPAQVLRAEAEPLPAPRLVQATAFGLLIIGVFVTAWGQAQNFLHSLYFTLGLFGLAVTLTAGAKLVMFLAGRIPRERLHPYLSLGISALARPGAGTTGGIVALGLGVTVITSMLIVERDLSNGIRTLIPEDSPTMFFVDVQPDQWSDVQSRLAAHEATSVDSAAIVMGRLRTINGRDVADLARERGGRARWSLTREQRMATVSELPPSNTILERAGDDGGERELWCDPEVAEISMETGYAKGMGVKIGDTMSIDVQGRKIDVKLTTIRHVEWRSFSLNFFVMVEPEALADAPNLRFAAAKVPEPNEQPLQDSLSAAHPNVTMIQVRPLLEQVSLMFDKLSIGVRTLGYFTVFAGLAILAGAIGAASMRRRREAALLKTLGATRRGVTALFLAEYGLLGFVAGLMGSCGALLLAYGFLVEVADLEYAWPFWMIPIAALGAAALSATFGILASWHALRAPPRESLRG